MDILFYHPLHYAIDGADLSKIITIPEPVSEMRCGGGSRNIFREDLGGLHLKYSIKIELVVRKDNSDMGLAVSLSKVHLSSIK